VSDREPYIRPSSLEPIEECPARPLMESKAVALVPAMLSLASVPAIQGTLGHEVIAGVARDGFAGDWSRAAEVIAGVESRMLGLETWTKDAVRACVAYLVDLIKRHVPRYPRMVVLAETHLDGACIDIPRGGTADLILLGYTATDELELVIVADWKTGFVSQGDAADHLQLGAYAAMAAERWKPTRGVVVHLAMGRRREFTSAHYDQAALLAVGQRIKAAVAAARADEPRISPNLTSCRYCKALAFCRPARDRIMESIEDLRLFGADPSNRVQLANDAALAKAFTREAEALAKLWRNLEADRASRSTTTAGTN